MKWYMIPRTNDYRGYIIVAEDLSRCIISTDGIEHRAYLFQTCPAWVRGVIISTPSYIITNNVISQLGIKFSKFTRVYAATNTI